MSEEFKGRKPDFHSFSGVAVWKETTKKGEEYLKVKVLNLKPICCFKFKEKEEKVN